MAAADISISSHILEAATEKAKMDRLGIAIAKLEDTLQYCPRDYKPDRLISVVTLKKMNF